MRNAIWRKCSGEAHGNAYIDNCWTCAPYWEIFPACPDCGGKLVAPAHGHRSGRAARSRCSYRACASYGRWFLVENEPAKKDTWTWFGCIWTELAVATMHDWGNRHADY